jgi:hypothetical protein
MVKVLEDWEAVQAAQEGLDRACTGRASSGACAFQMLFHGGHAALSVRTTKAARKHTPGGACLARMMTARTATRSSLRYKRNTTGRWLKHFCSDVRIISWRAPCC